MYLFFCLSVVLRIFSDILPKENRMSNILSTYDIEKLYQRNNGEDQHFLRLYTFWAYAVRHKEIG